MTMATAGGVIASKPSWREAIAKMTGTNLPAECCLRHFVRSGRDMS